MAEHPSEVHRNSVLHPCLVAGPSEAPPSEERQTRALRLEVVPSAVHPSAVLRMLALLLEEAPSEEPQTLAHRLEALPLEVLQRRELLQVVEQVSRPVPTVTSSDCRPGSPRKNHRLHRLHRVPLEEAELRTHPFHLVKREEAAQHHHQGSFSAEADTPRSSQAVQEAHRHHHHPPSEAAVLPLRRPRTRHTCCRACPCP